ncbi:MAG: hypothetical protein WBD07_15940 [Vicinamibacterales bacterium]
MSKAKPQKIVIEFAGGAKVESSFDALPHPLQVDLLRQPFASAPSPAPDKEKFLLLEWQDGWKEVTELDPTCKGVSRYTVITRPDDVGRLAIHREDGFPELVEVIRRPLMLKSISVLDTGVETVQPKVEKSVREGKKIDHFHKLNKDGDARAEQVEALKKAAAAEGIDLKQLKAGAPGGNDQLEKLRKQMGIRAGSRQQDVWDFIAYLAKHA